MYTSKIFLDTSFLLSLIRTEDQMHTRAREICDNESDLIISNFVFNEFVSFLHRKNGARIAYEEGVKILESDILIVDIRLEDLPEMLQMVKKYEKLSLCDAASVKVMKELGICQIISFDSDFDVVPGIQRIY